MSKNIVIQEGGQGKQLTADKLKTNLVGGGTCLWVPEDEVRLGTKFISENGTYKASVDGYYGYSEVTVSGIGTATGKDPDGSGDDATATVDPGTGEITITKIPSSIDVITPPTNPTGYYTNGQTITKDGMVVKAYLESGGEYGTVPIGEISLNPTTAIYDPSSVSPGYDEKTSDLQTNWGQPIMVANGVTYHRITSLGDQEDYYTVTAPNMLLYFNNQHHLSFVILSSNNSTPVHITYTTKERYKRQGVWSDWTETTTEGDELTVNGGNTRDGKSVYFSSHTIGYSVDQIAPTPNSIGPDDNTMWTALYGTIEGSISGGSHQTITVAWPRPGDGKELTTSFDIVVHNSLGGATGGGGEAGDTGAGRND